MDLLNRAMKIVNENDAFYYKDEIVDGTPFRIFNYRLASYEDFAKDTFALELRGLTFNLNTKEHFFGLHKFFNDNENPFTMGDENWEGKRLECREKLDGSLIQCIIDNGKIYAKTKGTFNSEQAKEAQKIIDSNKNYQDFILKMYEKGYFVYFEYISPFNQIVVEYPETELKLIQIRNKYGSYLSYPEMKILAEVYDIPYVRSYNLDKIEKLIKNISENQLENILKNKKFKKNIEFFEFLEKELNGEKFDKDL